MFLKILSYIGTFILGGAVGIIAITLVAGFSERPCAGCPYKSDTDIYTDDEEYSDYEYDE